MWDLVLHSKHYTNGGGKGSAVRNPAYHITKVEFWELAWVCFQTAEKEAQARGLTYLVKHKTFLNDKTPQNMPKWKKKKVFAP